MATHFIQSIYENLEVHQNNFHMLIFFTLINCLKSIDTVKETSC